MTCTRRQLLLGTAFTCFTPRLFSSPGRAKVIIIGGGWGGLAAARQLAAFCDVLMIERNSRFISLPLSNRCLAGLDNGHRLYQDYHATAQALGYRYLQDNVLEINRAQRQVRTISGHWPYDWLIVAAGISELDQALFANDKAAAIFTRQHFSSAYTASQEIPDLALRLAKFSGGEFLMTLPLAPYRCPPAPYERAVIIAQAIKARGLKARLTLVDPNAPWPAYQRIFNEFYRDQIHYLPNTRLRQLDPYRRIAVLDIDEIHFSEAIIMPAQQAAMICQQTELCPPNSAWANIDPKSFRSLADEKIFVIGDSAGSVSPLFGHYPKTGQLASRMGEIAAAAIIANLHDQPQRTMLPESSCYTYLNLAPPEFVRIDAHYRLRGDGVIVQNINQYRENNPQGEDDTWLNTRHEELFGPATQR